MAVANPTLRLQRLACGGLALLLASALATFWPGLAGPFVFDDLTNIRRLGDFGGVDSQATLLHYLFGGPSALGRPISFLSFLLHDTTWPTDPWPFKYTNVLLHMLNGVFVFIVSRQLCRLSGTPNNRQILTALVVTAIWLLHPIHVATMLQAVQRMTELSALFVLIGIAGYLYGRDRLAQMPRTGLLIMSASIGFGGLLATFSKENGVLLPVYVLAIEATLVTGRGVQEPRLWWRWSALFLWAPIALLIAYFGLNWDAVEAGYNRRTFGMGERLLTQPRILFDYLHQIALPRMGGSGLFYDDYPVSRGLFQPMTTIVALGGLLGALILALLVRRGIPVLAFAILWFVGGHILESSFVGLELYFEHRNYLPMLGPIFAAAYFAIHVPAKKYARAAIAFLGLFVVMEAAISSYSSRTWSDELTLATVWSKENPDSFRAQQFAAATWLDHGHKKRAFKLLRAAGNQHPDRLTPPLQLALAHCQFNQVTPALWPNVMAQATDARYAPIALSSIEALRVGIQDGTCAGIGIQKLQELEKLLLKNANFRRDSIALTKLHFELAHTYAAQRLLAPTIHHVDAAYQVKPSVDAALQGALWLYRAGQYAKALEYVALARQTPKDRLYRFLPTREAEFQLLENAIREAQQSKPETTL